MELVLIFPPFPPPKINSPGTIALPIFFDTIDIEGPQKMSQTDSTPQFIIQVERPGEKLDLAKIRALFEGTDVQLDDNYGPFLVNPKLSRYVVRGTATAQARAKAEQIQGVRFFPDIRQQPM